MDASGQSAIGTAVVGVSDSTAELVAVISTLATQVTVLGKQVSDFFRRLSDVELYLYQPGVGQMLGAGAARQFGDDPLDASRAHD